MKFLSSLCLLAAVRAGYNVVDVASIEGNAHEVTITPTPTATTDVVGYYVAEVTPQKHEVTKTVTETTTVEKTVSEVVTQIETVTTVETITIENPCPSVDSNVVNMAPTPTPDFGGNIYPASPTPMESVIFNPESGGLYPPGQTQTILSSSSKVFSSAVLLLTFLLLRAEIAISFIMKNDRPFSIFFEINLSMNIGSKTTNGLLFVDFNQDSSCISLGTRTGYKIYTCDPFGKCYGKRGGGIGIASMLFCTSLIALVGAGEHPQFSPRRLQIINTKRQSTICELTFSTTVLGVKLNRKRLVVVLEEHIYVYDISNMKLLHTIDTSPNPNAASSDNCYLAYPSTASTTLGEVLIFDAVKLQAVNIIQAHKSPLSCVAFNDKGTLIVTSSDKGTVIRVFSVPDGVMCFQFRRGTYTARILSLAFNQNSDMLCVASDTDTIHIYKLEPASQQPVRRNTGLIDQITSPLQNAVGTVNGFLPSNITNIWEPTRHFAFAKIPMKTKEKGLHISSFVPGGNLLCVVSSIGSLYLFKVDDQGGECVLKKEESIMDPEED